ncbi:MAG: hypothetical protein ACXADB_00930 [Candidatus Hermodarchaeia archaeon]|jgi:hypothetical protein
MEIRQLLVQITAGDAVMNDGSLSITDADDAATLSIINNTASTVGVGANTTGIIDFASTSLTTGNLLNLEANALTSGVALNVGSTTTDTTAITSGMLGYFNWNPGSSTTKSGDLFRLNIGSNGNVTNLLNITDNGSTLFRVAETQIESAVPHAFTAAGDVSIAYDLVFTNQTAAGIESYGPLTIESGESFENNNLTLKTYGTGDIVFDLDGTGSLQAQGPDPSIILDTTTATDTDYWLGVVEDASNDDNDYFSIGDGTTIGSNRFFTIDTDGKTGIGNSTPVGLLDIDSSNTSTFGKAAVIIDHDETQDILSASASGTTVFTIDVDGDIAIGAETTNDDDAVYFDDGSTEYLTWDDDPGEFDLTDDLTLPDDSYLGIGSSDARIVFDTGNDLNLTGANVGVNQGTPLWQLHVTDSETATGSAMIENTADVGDNNVIGMMIRLGGDSDNPAAGDRFINFMKGDSTIVGKIAGNGSGAVDYATNGTDYAEYFKKADPSTEIPFHTLICQSENGIVPCSKDQNQIIGITSDTPGFTGGMQHEDNPAYELVGLLGQVRVKVNQEAGEIKNGDPLTVSSIAGMATKAKNAGRIVGYAIRDPQLNEACTLSAGTEVSCGYVTAYVNPGWHEPNLAVTNLGDLNLTKVSQTSQTENWELKVSDTGQLIDQLGAFAELAAANIKAGAISTQELFVEGVVNVAGSIKAGAIETNSLISKIIKTDELITSEISPADGSDLVVNLSETADSGFGRLLVKGVNGETVASIDESGNAEFSGELKAESLKSNDASIAGELRVGKIYADEIISQTSQNSLTREEIEGLLAEAESDQNLLDQASTWNIDTATNSAALSELALESLFVTGTAALNSLSVAESAVIGNDLVFNSKVEQSNGEASVTNSINTLTSPLYIQSAAAQPLHLMANLVTIDTSGNIQVTGNLAVEGTIETSGLTLKSPATNHKEPSATSGFGKLLALYDETGTEIAGITATGAARFVSVETDIITLTGDPEATSSATFSGLVYKTDATAGTAKIPVGSRQVVIENPNVAENSLIFVTPTSKIESTLYIKEQTSGKFTVGFPKAAEEEVTFNWWLVDMVASTQEKSINEN